eukprot:16439159-Heterocapsa_arctica.AAC.1
MSNIAPSNFTNSKRPRSSNHDQVQVHKRDDDDVVGAQSQRLGAHAARGSRCTHSPQAVPTKQCWSP